MSDGSSSAGGGEVPAAGVPAGAPISETPLPGAPQVTSPDAAPAPSVVVPEAPEAGSSPPDKTSTEVTPELDPAIALLQQQLERAIADDPKASDGEPVQDSRSALKDIAAGPQEMERQTAVQVMNEREERYQHSFGERAGKGDLEVARAKRQELTDRYASEGASRAATEQRIAEYADKVGADRAAGLEAIPEETAFAAEGSHDVIMAQVETLIQAYFNSDRGSFSKEGDLDQAGIVREQTQQYVQLIADGIAEGSIPADISARDVYKLAADNVAALGLQDRAASEVLIGDHGVRHLIDHNTRVASLLASQLAEKGYPMTAKDTLLLHQIMMYHDIGYAMDPVRGAMREQGVKGQDAGHALLAAQFVREQMVDPASPWHKVFNTQDFETMHRAISFHDTPDTGVKQVDFSKPEGPADIEGKRRILESIVRTADNTHAFEDKLPALMYALPESLRYMRLLKTAGETGDAAAIATIKEQFVASIQASSDISTGDKEAFTQAVGSLIPQSYAFTVGRIAGRKPEFTLVDHPDGGVQVQITVTESRAHRSVVELFGMESYQQMRKFVQDVLGEKFNERDFQNGRVSSRDLAIQLRKRDEARRTSSLYERNVMKELSGKEFQGFLRADREFAIQDSKISTALNAKDEISDAELRLRAQLTLGLQGDDMPNREGIVAALQAAQTDTRQRRAANLQSYLAQQA